MLGGTGLGGVLVIGIVLSILVIWSAWVQRSSSIEPNDPMPDVTFDFQQSWLTTFTGLIALLGSLNFSALALSNDISFSILSLFFATLVAIAPLVYKASGASGGKETVGGFLVASALTLWAAFGVVLSLSLVLNQVVLVTETSPELATVLIMAVIVLAIPLIAVYAHGKLSSLLKSPKALAGEANFL